MAALHHDCRLCIPRRTELRNVLCHNAACAHSYGHHRTSQAGCLCKSVYIGRIPTTDILVAVLGSWSNGRSRATYHDATVAAGAIDTCGQSAFFFHKVPRPFHPIPVPSGRPQDIGLVLHRHITGRSAADANEYKPAGQSSLESTARSTRSISQSAKRRDKSTDATRSYAILE